MTSTMTDYILMYTTDHDLHGSIITHESLMHPLLFSFSFETPHMERDVRDRQYKRPEVEEPVGIPQ